MNTPLHRLRFVGLAGLLLLSALAACDGNLFAEGGGVGELTADGGADAESPALDGGSASPDAALTPEPDAARPRDPDAWTPPLPSGCDDPIEREVIRLANEARSSMGLRALTCDPMMVAVARGHSTDMCTRNYFDHTGLDGRSPFDRMRDGGVRFSTAGENIAWGQSDAREVHTSWMNSPGHRRNILGSGYGRIGVGLDRCSGRMYWTQIFAD